MRDRRDGGKEATCLSEASSEPPAGTTKGSNGKTAAGRRKAPAERPEQKADGDDFCRVQEFSVSLCRRKEKVNKAEREYKTNRS